MPDANDTIPTPVNAAVMQQKDSLAYKVRLNIEEFLGDTDYTGKEVTAAQLYGDKATLQAKTVKPHESRDGIPREYPLGSSWAFLPMIGVILLALLLLRYTRGYLSQLLLLPVNYKAAHKQYKSSLQNFNRILLILTLFAVIPLLIISVFVLNTFPNQLEIGRGYELYLIVGGFIVGFTILKTVILSVAGVLTYEEGLVNELRYNSRIFLGSWGIIVLPFILLLVLNDSIADKTTFLIIIIGLSILLFILYLIRSFQLFLSQKVSIFFWILYLCTLELLPALLVFDYLFPFR